MKLRSTHRTIINHSIGGTARVRRKLIAEGFTLDQTCKGSDLLDRWLRDNGGIYHHPLCSTGRIMLEELLEGSTFFTSLPESYTRKYEAAARRLEEHYHVSIPRA